MYKRQEYYSDKKKTLKKDVNTVIDILNYNIAKSNLSDEELKMDAIRLLNNICLLYTSDAADERSSVDLGGRRIIKKKKKEVKEVSRII